MSEDTLLAEVEGPRGKAEILEVTLPNTGSTIEVEYVVTFGAERLSFPSMGEAHLKANELTGAD